MAFPEFIGLFSIGAIIVALLTSLAIVRKGRRDRDCRLMQFFTDNPVAAGRWVQRWGRPEGHNVRWWQWGHQARQWRRSARLGLPEKKKKEQASQWGQDNGNGRAGQPTGGSAAGIRGPVARPAPAFVLPLTFAGRVRTSDPEGWEDVELTLTREERRCDEPSESRVPLPIDSPPTV